MAFPVFTTSDGSVMDKRTDGVAVSSTNTYYSSPISARLGDGFSLQLRWTGTPTGTFTVWKANKPNPDRTNDADWDQDADFNGSGSLAAAGAAGGASFSAMNAKNDLWRVKYVNASGTGTIFAYMAGHRTY